MGSTRIKPLVAIAATLGAGALVLSACGGGSGDGASGSSAAPESSAATSSAASESPAAEGACAPEDIFLVQSGRGLENEYYIAVDAGAQQFAKSVGLEGNYQQRRDSRPLFRI